MNKIFRVAILFPAFVLSAPGALAQVPNATTPDSSAGASTPSASSVPADNSKRNRDPSNRARTADDQKENATDRTLTKEIRQSVMADKSLSTYAHNVKIVAVNGTVTLNGVVRSEEEKASVASKAEAVAGAGRVVNDLKIQPSK